MSQRAAGFDRPHYLLHLTNIFFVRPRRRAYWRAKLLAKTPPGLVTDRFDGLRKRIEIFSSLEISSSSRLRFSRSRRKFSPRVS